MKKSFKLIATAALSALVLQGYFISAIAETANLPVWTQRSVDTIKEELTVSNNGNEFSYTIKWGDTLSLIAEAMGMSTKELAVINNIENPDYIVAGSTLVFNAGDHTLTIENQSGNEIAYSLNSGAEVKPRQTVIDSVDEWVEDSIVTPASLPVVEEVEEWVAPEQPAEETVSEESVTEEAEQASENIPEETEEPAETLTTTPETTIAEEVTEAELVEHLAEVEVVEGSSVEPLIEEADQSETEEPIAEQPLDTPVVDEPPVEETVPVESGSLASQGLSAEEIAAKEWIAQRESGGDYNAINPNGPYIGRYQLLADYLNGDHSPENQERVANQYVIDRYGSWVEAKNFWMANNWY